MLALDKIVRTLSSAAFVHTCRYDRKIPRRGRLKDYTVWNAKEQKTEKKHVFTSLSLITMDRVKFFPEQKKSCLNNYFLCYMMLNKQNLRCLEMERMQSGPFLYFLQFID